jgi:hypothetical protein
MFYKLKYSRIIPTPRHSGDIMIAVEKTNQGKPLFIVYIENEKTRHSHMDSDSEPIIELEDDSNHFEPISYVEPKEINLVAELIAGASGSGKSYQCQTLVNNLRRFHKKYKDYKIYLITGQETEDPVYEDNFKDYQIININHPDFARLKWSDFSKSIIIYDDVESLQNKDLEVFINRLQNACLQNGRRAEVISFHINHALLGGIQTKFIIQECPSINIYPRRDTFNVENFLLNKLLYKRELVDHLLKLNTRVLTIRKSYPQYYISKEEIGIIAG